MSVDQQIYEESKRLTYLLGLPVNCTAIVRRLLIVESKLAKLEEAVRNAGHPPHLQHVERRGYRGQKTEGKNV